MRTSASYMFDKANECAEVSLHEDGSATIEFRGGADRQHYIRINGLNPKVCQELSEKLAKASKILSVDPMKRMLSKFDAAIKEWKGRGAGKDKDLAKAYRQDAVDMRKVYRLVVDGRYKQAFRMARRLDTIVRENIPGEIWDFLEDLSR